MEKVTGYWSAMMLTSSILYAMPLAILSFRMSATVITQLKQLYQEEYGDIEVTCQNAG